MPNEEKVPNRSVTGRGFHVYDELNDTYGISVSIYESSAASAPHVWINIGSSNSPESSEAAHLSIEQVRRVRDALNVFLEEIPGRWENGDEFIKEG